MQNVPKSDSHVGTPVIPEELTEEYCSFMRYSESVWLTKATHFQAAGILVYWWLSW